MKLEWLAKDILSAVQGRSNQTQDWSISGISIDSRTTQPGDLFIAIKGDALDGHDYVRAAFDAGATAAIVSRQPSQMPADAPLVFVEDTLAAMQALGLVARKRTNAKIIAVTGSVGKTSTKEQLKLMLGAVNDTFANEGSLNNHWGVPLSLARMPETTKYGIFEIGMNHPGELTPLSQAVSPHVVLITNVEAVHLEFFASVEAIADAKAEIFAGLSPGGIAVLNRDNDQFDRLAAAAKKNGVGKILSFGKEAKADACLLDLSADEKGTNVQAQVLGEKISYRLNTPGAHLALNALGSLLVCAALGADIHICAEALSTYRPPAGRGTRRTIPLPNGQTFSLIDETFNASPVATKAAIDVLGTIALKPGGRRIVALGDMRELGEKGPELHASLAENLIRNQIDIVHCCGELMSNLYETLPVGMRGQLSANSKELAPLVAEDVRPDDVIMVKGSKSMKMPYVIEALEALADAGQQKQKIAL